MTYYKMQHVTRVKSYICIFSRERVISRVAGEALR